MADGGDAALEKLSRLLSIVRRLRGEDGCSWDRAQTVASLSPFMLEEAYEVADAIADGTPDILRNELGDLLLHVVMSALICEEEGKFSLEDVVGGISDKLVRRHPHVFGEGGALQPDEVEKQWEAIKAREKVSEGFFGSIPSGMPALQTAWRIQQRASEVGFDWPETDGSREKILEELEEFETALASEDENAQLEELGDVLFSVVNYIRMLGFEPEAALRACNRKFIRRFTGMEQRLRAQGLSLEDADIDQMEKAWQETKTESG